MIENNAPSESVRSRMLGALWGLAVGDALGVPVEFTDREFLTADPVTGLRGHGVHGQPRGTWSDDTSMMLCTAEAIVERFDLAKMGQLFVAWARQSYWTPHDDVFDIGIATRQAVGRLAEGCAPEDAGGEGEYSNGNGSVMRILPVALRYWNRPDAAVADLAARASRLTHRHERSQLACAFFCLLVVRLLRGMPLPGALAEASESFAALYAESPEFGHFARLTGGKLAAADRGSIRSSGYVIHTLEAAVWACLRNGETYSRAVLAAVNLGDDTDTVGAVAGALMGAAVGFPEVPEAWRRELARREDLMEFFGRFVTACLTSGSVRGAPAVATGQRRRAR